mmetsp:Transcript_79236/g.169757  ORF Transcript_79236/g.169757 Transcript_79236/m.169757 type:complete len:402 (-) Transcript_79236:1967-3172(-)
MILQAMGEKDRIGVHFDGPVVISPPAVVPDITPDRHEAVNVGVRAPSRLARLATAEEGVLVALVYVDLVRLDVARQLSFSVPEGLYGPRVPRDDRETEQGGALNLHTFGRWRNLPHLPWATHHVTDPIRRWARHPAACEVLVLLVTGVAVTLGEVHVALNVVATLGLCAIITTPRALHKRRHVGLRIEDGMQVLQQHLLALYKVAIGGVESVLVLDDVEGIPNGHIAALVPPSPDRLSAIRVLLTPLCALLGRGHIAVSDDGIHRPCATVEAHSRQVYTHSALRHLLLPLRQACFDNIQLALSPLPHCICLHADGRSDRQAILRLLRQGGRIGRLGVGLGIERLGFHNVLGRLRPHSLSFGRRRSGVGNLSLCRHFCGVGLVCLALGACDCRLRDLEVRRR